MNSEVVKIDDAEEYSEVKRKLLDPIDTRGLKEGFEEAMKRSEPFPSQSEIFGVKCEGWVSESGTHYSCGRMNFWKVTVYSDIPITRRRT